MSAFSGDHGLQRTAEDIYVDSSHGSLIGTYSVLDGDTMYITNSATGQTGTVTYRSTDST